MHLGQRGGLVGHVAQAEGDRQVVEGAVGERQRLGIDLQPLEAADATAIVHAPAAGFEHGPVDVGDEHLAAGLDPSPDEVRDIARAPGEIQHRLAGPQAAAGHEVALPQPVDADRHQVVHQVVAIRHRREHAADQLRLLLG